MNEDMLQPGGSRTVPNSRLTCAQCERMILDAIDHTLLPDDQTQFDLHVAGCSACGRAVEDAHKGAAWLDMLKAVPPEPPIQLLAAILAKTSGDPAMVIPVLRGESILGSSRSAYPQGHMASVLPFQTPVKRNWFARATQAAMQPRFAMTAAMAFFSVALTMNLTGVHLNDLHASSFKPSSLRHGFWAVNNKVFRYYDNLRVVYELESRVREIQRQDDDRQAVPKVTQPQQSGAQPSGKAPEKKAGPRSSNSTVPRSHTQAVLDRSVEPVLLTLHDGSPAVSTTGKRGEGVRV